MPKKYIQHVAPTMAVDFSLTPRSLQKAQELPLCFFIIADFHYKENGEYLEDRRPIRINKTTFDDILSALSPKVSVELKLNAPGKLDKENITVELVFSSLSDFEPSNIIERTDILRQLHSRLLCAKNNDTNLILDDEKFSSNYYGSAKDIKLNLSNALLQILHNEEFRALEATWRGLDFFLSKIDAGDNIVVEILQATKEELLEDFEDAEDSLQDYNEKYGINSENIGKQHYLRYAGLFRLLHMGRYGAWGGTPASTIILDHQFSRNREDTELLKYLSDLCEITNTPLIAVADPCFFDNRTIVELPTPEFDHRTLKGFVNCPKYIHWNRLRDLESSKYIYLTYSRFLLRTPHEDNNSLLFPFHENRAGKHELYAWGNAPFLVGCLMVGSFKQYRWCPNILGRHDGVVANLPIYHYDGKQVGPTERVLSAMLEYDISEQGFIVFTHNYNEEDAIIFAANSVRAEKYFENSEKGKSASLNYRLNSQLPYILMITRVAHYLQILSSGHLEWNDNWGNFYDPTARERNMNNWIRKYVLDWNQTTADINDRRRRLLRSATVKIASKRIGYQFYPFELEVQPEWKYMGLEFQLCLGGWLYAD